MTKRIFTLFLILLMSINIFANNFDKIVRANSSLVKCWNKSNLRCVIYNHYYKNVVYTSNNGPIEGRKNLYNIFYNTFLVRKQNKLNMGQLTVKFLYHKKISYNTYLTIEKYTLKNTPNHSIRIGYASLLWKHINNQWKIIADHPKDI